MSGRRQKALRRGYRQVHGESPSKGVLTPRFDLGAGMFSRTPSEWRRLKARYKRGHEGESLYGVKQVEGRTFNRR